MKTIELKTWRNVISPIAAKDTLPITITAAKLIADCVNSMPAGGITTNEMRMRVKILDKLERAKGKTVSFEDAEFETLVKCVADTKFAFNHVCFIEFDDLIKAAAKTR